MSFFGLLTFQAPYLPWVLFAFSLLLGNSVIVDILGGRTMTSQIGHYCFSLPGITVGHIYYFLEDVFPHKPGGFHILKTPGFL